MYHRNFWVWEENPKDISFPLFLNGDIITFPRCLEEKKNHDSPKKILKFLPLPKGEQKLRVIFPLYRVSFPNCILSSNGREKKNLLEPSLLRRHKLLGIKNSQVSKKIYYNLFNYLNFWICKFWLTIFSLIAISCFIHIKKSFSVTYIHDGKN